MGDPIEAAINEGIMIGLLALLAILVTSCASAVDMSPYFGLGVDGTGREAREACEAVGASLPLVHDRAESAAREWADAISFMEEEGLYFMWVHLVRDNGRFIARLARDGTHVIGGPALFGDRRYPIVCQG